MKAPAKTQAAHGLKRRSRKRGLPPGSLVYVGESRPDAQARLSVYSCDDKECLIQEKASLQSLARLPEKPLHWIDIVGLSDIGLIKSIGERYQLHPLLLEDALNTTQRPKIEEIGKVLFWVLKATHWDSAQRAIRFEQMSFFLSNGSVISLQEDPQESFDPIRERLKKRNEPLRMTSSAFLLCSLIDSIVDGYFLVLENLGAKIENLEAQLLDEPKENIAREVRGIRNELLLLRKAVFPLREILARVLKGEFSCLPAETRLYFSDVHDHVVQIVDEIQINRDILSSMMDLTYSLINHRTNESIRFLTIFASIFIPLTFLVGVYGMNFEYMPELNWRYGYLALWIFMIALALGMLAYFKRKNWIGRGRRT